MGNSFSFNGGDMSGFGLVVLRSRRSLASSAVFDSRLAPGFDRAVASPSYYGPKIIALDCVVVGSSASDLKTKLDGIGQYLATREDAELSLDAWPGRYWLARPSGSASFVQAGNVASASVEFTASDPFSFGSTLTTETKTWPAVSLEFEVGGSFEATPTIVYQASAATSVVSIENSDTDERVAWTGDLVAGDKLKFDGYNWWTYKQAVGSDDWVSAMGGQEGVYPRLRVGTNVIRLLAPGTGTVWVEYRERYQV